jgi:hypothetical protein
MMLEYKKRETHSLETMNFYTYLGELVDDMDVDLQKYNDGTEECQKRIEASITEFSGRQKENAARVKELELVIYNLSKDLIVG